MSRFKGRLSLTTNQQPLNIILNTDDYYGSCIAATIPLCRYVANGQQHKLLSAAPPPMIIDPSFQTNHGPGWLFPVLYQYSVRLSVPLVGTRLLQYGLRVVGHSPTHCC